MQHVFAAFVLAHVVTATAGPDRHQGITVGPEGVENRQHQPSHAVNLMRKESDAALEPMGDAVVHDDSSLVDCDGKKQVNSCPVTSNADECTNAVVESFGIRYVCFYLERYYGSADAADYINRCNLDQKSAVCRQKR
eukprot:gb/GFBE01014013.1/.p1 GENE.gb/GFBE01014013.1/~~gb/GFBE01014013.1/.p1  ORF type:complete len:137 (+),score=25.45 gb/GFBE01014013.1/:1-411(+)